MYGKYLIGVLAGLLLLAIIVFTLVGFIIVKKNGFSGIRTMLGSSELDKLIDKINNYINND